MLYFNTKHKQKSAIITTIMVAILLFVVFNFGLKYLDPPEEYGITINFGNSNVGLEKPFQETNSHSSKNKTIEKPQKEVIETPKETIQEKMISDNNSKEIKVVDKKETKKKPIKKKIQKEIKKEIPKKPSKEAQDALNRLLNNHSMNDKQKGEGNDNKEGIKGNIEGNPNSKKYYGNNGSGGGNYKLNGRNPLDKPTVKPNCQEEGIVVVSIKVNKNGQVIAAVPGVKGSTNTAECLLKAAQKAALKTPWNPDEKAPNNQIGTISYKFTLTK